MIGSWCVEDLPGLNSDNAIVTSPLTNRYNCIAWAAGVVDRNWWPDARGIGYWPRGVVRSETREAFISAFGTLGFSPCPSGDSEPGTEKVALFGIGPRGHEVLTHAARQLVSGEWTSKLGTLEDITHSGAGDVAGPAYGRVICHLCCSRT